MANNLSVLGLFLGQFKINKAILTAGYHGPRKNYILIDPRLIRSRLKLDRSFRQAVL
jgi:hypothetical protein